jgi:flagellar basal body-associated protein FliL
MSDTAKPPKAGTSAGKNKFLIVGLVGLLAAGGYYWWSNRAPAPAAHAAPVHVERGIVAFDPFVVNLADSNVSRFLRVSLQLVVGDEAQAEKLAESKVALMQARSAILELLTMQKSDTLVTPEGKAALRAAIVERVSEAVKPSEVVDVLFSDFVVQF